MVLVREVMAKAMPFRRTPCLARAKESHGYLLRERAAGQPHLVGAGPAANHCARIVAEELREMQAWCPHVDIHSSSVYTVDMVKRTMQETTFLILTALAASSQHGYGIITDVTRISDGRV